jgi:hypothetical protein
VREEDRDDEGDLDGGRGEGGRGDETVAFAKLSVATSSVFSTGFPQAEQKRTLSGKLLAHDGHFILIFPATGYLKKECRGGRPRPRRGAKRPRATASIATEAGAP